MKHLILALCAAAALFATAAPAAERGTVSFTTGCKIDYYRTHALGTVNPKITRVVFWSHGVGRNASDYIRYAESAAKTAGVTGYTAIISPQFGENKRTGYCYWPSSTDDLADWEHGGNDKAKGMSSFQAMDELIAKAKAAFPNATRITVAGHSAGGKFVGRYAIATMLQLPELRFVPMNPSSWAYLNDQRPSGSGWAPGPAATCSRVNRWRYGLEGMSTSYLAQAHPGAAARYASQPVRILAGVQDTVADDDMDTTCMGMAQGQHRYARAVNYDRHLDAFFAGNRTDRLDVPNVGHSASKMINSPVGRQTVFQGSW